MNWDLIVSILIIAFLILVVWARISNQTIKEVIIDIKEMLSNKKEDVEETIEGVSVYE